MKKRRVVVTGMGVICPVGQDLDSTWQAVTEGRSGIGPITRFDASDLKVQIAAQVNDFDPAERFGAREARRMDRYTQFVLAASQEAVQMADLSGNGQDNTRIGVVVGSGIGGIGTIIETNELMREKGPRRISPFAVPMMIADTAPGQVAIEYDFRGPNFSVVSACASGANAIGEAASVIHRGSADVMVTGGSDAALVRTAIASFIKAGALVADFNDEPERACRPFDAKRNGFVAGEGAAMLVLEEYEHAKKRGAPILAEVLGYGSSADAFHVTAPRPGGVGMAQSMQAALDDAGLAPEEIDYLNAHGTSTQLNDPNETKAAKQVFGDHAYKMPVSSTKSVTGHLMGGAGALEAVICVQAMRNGLIPPTINYEFPDPECDLDYVPNQARPAELNKVMTNSFGFGGHNATLILGVVDD